MASKYTTRDKPCRTVIINDLHCGHLAGINPPGFGSEEPKEEAGHWRSKAFKAGRAIYDWYRDDMLLVRKEKPIDVVVVVGDALDGRGDRSGSSELVTSDRLVQCRMAKKIINLTKAPNVLMAYGTAYHTGNAEDFEDYLRDIVEMSSHVKRVKLGSHEWLKINDTIFDIKHHGSGSGIPHGRATPLLKSKLWNMIWADRGMQPNADVLLRAHTHYHLYVGDDKYLSMSLPCLQGTTKFGSRRCEGLVNIGYTVFDTTPGGGVAWEARIADIPEFKAEAIEF